MRALGVVKHGKRKIRDFTREASDSFPDFKVKVKSLFVAGSRANMEIMMSCTAVKTGNKVSVKGASIFELGEGKIKRHIDYYDSATVKSQLSGI
ncbi:MAG: ester cyclase [Candidatus Bathyarchaeia archaeon]